MSQTIVARVGSGKSRLEEVGERIEVIDRQVVAARGRLREIASELVKAVAQERESVRHELNQTEGYVALLAGDQALADLAYIRLMGNGHYRGLAEEWAEVPRKIDELECERIRLGFEAESLRDEARRPAELRALADEVEELRKRERKLVEDLRAARAVAVDKLMRNVPRVVQVLPHGFGLSNGEFVEYPHGMKQDEIQGLFRVVEEIVLKSLVGG